MLWIQTYCYETNHSCHLSTLVHSYEVQEEYEKIKEEEKKAEEEEKQPHDNRFSILHFSNGGHENILQSKHYH